MFDTVLLIKSVLPDLEKGFGLSREEKLKFCMEAPYPLEAKISATKEMIEQTELNQVFFKDLLARLEQAEKEELVSDNEFPYKIFDSRRDLKAGQSYIFQCEQSGSEETLKGIMSACKNSDPFMVLSPEHSLSDAEYKAGKVIIQHLAEKNDISAFFCVRSPLVVYVRASSGESGGW